MRAKFIAGEKSGTYYAAESVNEEDILVMAKWLARKRMAKGEMLSSPQASGKYLQTLLSDLEHEVFGVLFLDTRHRIITFKNIFRGTIDGASVHPREVVKEGLKVNAAAVILAHNHPSGVAEPSQADIQITARLKSALALVDIRVLDHLIVSAEGYVSLAQRGHV
jgi:DNA repair protein RadC